MSFSSIVKGLAVGLIAVASPRAQAESKAFVVVYDGWGTPTSFAVSGRVLEDQGERQADEKRGGSDNVVDVVKAFESDEVPGVDVVVKVAGQAFTATTDEDGIFTVRVKNLPAAQALLPGANAVVVEVKSRDGLDVKEGHGTIWIHADNAIGLISDIDDTIVKTFVTEKSRMVSEVLLKNAKQLSPVERAAKNYMAAQSAGVSGFFYLSGSPQNFYTRLKTYLASQMFPSGPMLLKNLGEDSLFKQDGYKTKRLEMLARDLPTMRFVLVGDSGEKDPEIYREFRKAHPERVIAIVIRKTPLSVNPPGRFDGMIVVDDKYDTDDVISRLLPRP
jgi:phosphatidate phosphatase APP1